MNLADLTNPDTNPLPEEVRELVRLLANVEPAHDLPEAPQPAKREPLTDEEIDAISDDHRDWEHQIGAFRNFARAIERAHGITGEGK